MSRNAGRKLPLRTRLLRATERLVRVSISEFRRSKRVLLPPEARAATERPIFIVGVHRSGTTLVRLIVDSHSRIACPPESFFLLPLAGLLDDAKALEGLRAMGFERDHVVARLREGAAYFFEMYAASRGKPRWADKTPAYVSHLDFIETLFGPDCRYVMVYRHGLDTACSIAGQPDITEAHEHIAACGGDRHAGAARYWAVQCRRMRAFAEARGERCLALHYEALVADPEAETRRLFAFLEEPWEPAVLRFAEQPHDSWSGLEDVRAMTSRGFTPNVGSYRREPPAVIRAMLAEAAPVLAVLGYDDVDEHLAAGSGGGS